jgi:hypothetical protein
MTDGRNGDAPPVADEDLEALEFEPLDPDAEIAATQVAAAEVGVSLGEAIEGLAAGATGVEQAQSGQGVEFRVAGQPFARLDGGGASFRIGSDIVRAALRTDGTRASPLGADWITFSPLRFDRYALDRATSWFELASRQALEGRGGPRRP